MVLTYQLTMDAADPTELARFWAYALGYELDPPPEPFDTWEDALTAWGLPPERWNDASAIRDPATPGSRIFIQRVPEPKTAKNRLHLDLDSGARRDDGTKDWSVMRELAARLVEVGATVELEFDEPPQGSWIVMHDPEGNEFCVC
jgi:hypothetical protein